MVANLLKNRAGESEVRSGACAMNYSVSQLLDWVEKEDSCLWFMKPCAIQTNMPIPNSRPEFYFEFQLLRFPPASVINIGLSPSATSTDPIKVFSFDSVCLDLTSGKIRLGVDPLVCSVVPGFKEGDVIGCHVTIHPGFTLCFSRNGIWGTKRTVLKVQDNLYPTVFGTEGCQVSFNFGQTEFIYSTVGVPSHDPINIDLPQYQN
ncbi:Protein ssh4 [Entomophthora muscae]|uniref:Protein ssh4 n=1 Tax=Entomophthora muscae TaxID=34485 RepID=A0ACC2TSM3_9FUNG|nr:Protein ssh4 [Entomophthora muscae]